jgi:hypothetical protein
MMRQIYADYDDTGIYVYQAYTPAIVEAALRKGTFAEGFGLDRMTWIKPSFGWMLYRSGYATKPNQEAILRIKITHEGWLTILRHSVETRYNDSQFFADIAAWKNALSRAEVRHQWDPERQINGEKLERRAIQVGIRGQMVCAYVNEWIVQLEEVTALAHAIHEAIKQKQPLPDVPEERVYAVDEEIQRRLGMRGNGA